MAKIEMDIPKYEAMKETFKKYALHEGRMLGWSKSHYINANKKDMIVFNANIISEKTGDKIWWGDLNITKDEGNLKKIADELNDRLYILRETDARFENETLGLDEWIKRSVWDSVDGIKK